MRIGSPAHRVGLVALFVIAALVAVQPLGVFWHFVQDHLNEHFRTPHDGRVVHLADLDAPDHASDHCHVCMTPADAAITPQVCQPHAVAGAGLFEDAPLPSAPQFPPFSPPRA